MTEIPEHLLKRSRERRQAIGGGAAGEGETASSAPTASTPATPATPAPRAAAPAPVAPAAPPPPKPDPPYLVADKRRTRIPIWAMPVLGLLPLWMFLYAKSLQPPTETLVGPLAAGQTLFGSCASCHGSSGEGGVGYQLSNGEVLKTFPKLEDQVTFIYTGNTPYIGKGYGDPNRPGGQHVGGKLGAAGAMPAWGQQAGGSFSDVELIEVVCHERYTLSGADQTSQEFLDWCTADGAKYQAVVAGGLDTVGIRRGPAG